ncbi:SDR family NAD(P)-dependent oxidoreductase [Acinetobacter nosocomialis]|uniref:SDR family NAD(P)-dependent oxidoreductase n=1 Tax=Acinetobacter nosocomialis TaxID=106654 RepID=UPI0003139975|nr:SDR family oxidoreductase [Acinetobacter nosocomialis]AWL18350.1 SDR family NAD(P)-dependent oxidoreductase [Acinetobacter nosocomialis]
MSAQSKVLITGASSGIGSVYADRFAQRGHHLILVARDTNRLDKISKDLQEKYGVKVEFIQADLSKDQDISKIEDVLKNDVDIEILVNNAGITLSGNFLTQDIKEIETLMTLNMTAVVRLSHAVSEQLVRKGKGSIINLGSVVGLSPEFGSTIYGASKSFIHFFSQGLHLQLKDHGVHVQAVLPSATKTEIWERSGIDLSQVPPLMDVNDLVDAALIGFDRKETITIPVLKDENHWNNFEKSRMTLLPNFSSAEVAQRYTN